MLKKQIILLLLLLSATLAAAVPLEQGIYSSEYYLSIYPYYPPHRGEDITIRLRTFKPAEKVTIFSDREEKILLEFHDGYWWGKYRVPDDFEPVSHQLFVWIRYFYPHPTQPGNIFTKISGLFGFAKQPASSFWSQSSVWYKVKETFSSEASAAEETVFSPSFEAAENYQPPVSIVTGESITVSTPSEEGFPLIIKGSKTLAVVVRSIEGSKEGFVPGALREESLRLNIAGKSEDVEVNANLISTSTAGTTQVSQREDKVSVLVKKGSTEAYLGDFTSDFNETEFTRLNKVLSGVYVKGDYGRFGFNALYSSPKGTSQFKRLYGNGTQGPYTLDYAPVVINSENVYADGVLQKRGDDYTVDYQAGTITFIRKTIDPKSILNISYDYSQNIYQHSTYGLRLTTFPKNNLKLGFTYLNDSDSLSGAQEIRDSMAANPVDPQSHYVVGAEGSFLSENVSAAGEIAYSNKNYNLFTTTQEAIGKAVKLDVDSQFGPFGLTAHGKRVGANYLPIADSLPKQNISEYGSGLSFRPSSLFGSQAEYNYERYNQGGVDYENVYHTARASLTPEKYPSLEYNYSLQDQSNDPVTGSSIQRTIRRDSAESDYRAGFISATLKGTTEKWLERAPSEEVTDYRRVNFGLATVGIEKFSFASNLELENRAEPDGANPYRRTYNLALSANPSKNYFISSSLQYLEDSAQGISNVTDLSYRAEPNPILRTDGKYTIATVNEEYVTTETVSKQSGSFSFDLRPARFLRARYLYKPSLTRILRTDTISYSNVQSQVEFNVIPINEAMAGVLYKTGHSFNIDQYNYSLRNNSADTDSTLYTIKLAPFQIFSNEFNYEIDNGRSTQLITAEPAAYLPGQSYSKKFDAAIKTSLSEKFSIDARYIYQRQTQGSGESFSNLVDGVSHTASLKGIWNISDAWSVSLTGAYTKSIDNLAAQPLSYTYSPAAGFIYRYGTQLRVDFDYIYSKSYAGLSTEKHDCVLKTKYSLSEYVNVTFRGEREISSSPDYRLTDLSLNVEINL